MNYSAHYLKWRKIKMIDINNMMESITIQEIREALQDCTSPSEYRDIICQFLQNYNLTGTAEDFHNLSVELSRQKLYELACAILEIGLNLEQYARDVDLLADYIVYGIKCGEETKSDVFFNKLSQIPKRRWKWRAFDFSVDYLQQKAEKILDDDELDKAIDTMLHIAREYRKYYPHTEGSYVVEAGIYKFINNLEGEENILKEALEKIMRTPQCSLRLADIAFERGEYEQARIYLKNAKVSGLGKESHINIYYVYYLDIMCLVSILTPKNVTTDEIKELYSLFTQAEKLMSPENSPSDLYEILQQQICLFEVKTGYTYNPNDYPGVNSIEI